MELEEGEKKEAEKKEEEEKNEEEKKVWRMRRKEGTEDGGRVESERGWGGRRER